MNAEMNILWPKVPQGVGKGAFSHFSKIREARVTDECSFVQCKV